MIDLKNYESVNPILPGDFSLLPPGGYICSVSNSFIANSKAGNPMLVLFIDIAEGDFSNFFSLNAKRLKFPNDKWDNSAIYRQLIFDLNHSTNPFFKGLLSCFELSNPNSRFNYHPFDERSLIGKLIGFIFAHEQYKKRDNSIAIRSFIKFPKSISDIRNNNFSIPPLKSISANPSIPFSASDVNPDDVPF